jgi:hypothetical protein
LQPDRNDGRRQTAFESGSDELTGSRREWSYRDPGSVEYAADSAEQADVKHDLGKPDRHAERAIDLHLRLRRRRRTRSPNRKRQSAADWMAIERNYAPAHKIRALRQNGRQRRDNGVAGRGDVLECDGLSGRADQAQYQRRHRFVEREFEGGQRLCDHRAIRRLAADQRSVCLGSGRMRRCCEKRKKERNPAHPTRG